MKYTFTTDASAIIAALNTVNDMGLERFYESFAHMQAGQTRNERGVSLGFAWAALDTLPTTACVLVNLDFEDYMKALMPDAPDMVAACIEFNRLSMSTAKSE